MRLPHATVHSLITRPCLVPTFNASLPASSSQEKLVKKALTSSSTNTLLICSGTPIVAEPIVHPKVSKLSSYMHSKHAHGCGASLARHARAVCDAVVTCQPQISTRMSGSPCRTHMLSVSCRKDKHQEISFEGNP